MRHRKLAKRLICSGALATGLLGMFFFGLVSGAAQQIHRNPFEGLRPAWVKSGSDVPHEELAHAITDLGAHDGQRCEYLKLNTAQGSFLYYQYSTGRAPINDELVAGVWVK